MYDKNIKLIDIFSNNFGFKNNNIFYKMINIYENKKNIKKIDKFGVNFIFRN